MKRPCSRMESEEGGNSDCVRAGTWCECDITAGKLGSLEVGVSDVLGVTRVRGKIGAFA